MIPDAAVEAAARVLWKQARIDPWESAPDYLAAEFRHDALRSLEAAAPHILASAAESARANNDHIIPGGDGYSAGFHYALHCISPEDDVPCRKAVAFDYSLGERGTIDG